MVALNEQVAAENPTVIEVKKVDVAPTPVSDEDFEKAQKGFQQGKKFLVLNKFDEAVSNFDEACQIFSKKYGELNIECADLYFFYGKALLELARVENTVLGNALNGIPDDSVQINDSRYGNPDELEEKEREQIAEEVIDAMCEGGNQASEEVKKDEPMQSESVQPVAEVVPPVVEAKESVEAVVEQKQEEPVVEQKQAEVVAEVKQVDDVVEPKPVEGEGEGESKKSEDAIEEVKEGGEQEGDEAEVEGDEDEEGEGEGEEEDAENDDISNLQRSWELFELAKLVYKNNCEKDKVNYSKRIAECLLKLGEISIEQELYEQAITDISESIKMQEEDLREWRDERLLAETYYQLGLAQQFNNQFKLANESYQRSINILQIRIDKLKEQVNVGSDLSEEDKKQLNDEIAELEGILPEITGKLDECNEQDQQTMNLVKEAKECFINKFNGAPAANGSNENGSDVKDITSLVKSKRKISLSSPNDLKKSKLEEQNQDNNAAEEEQQQQPVSEVNGDVEFKEQQNGNDVPVVEQQ